ncbi:DUF222 domain-containing protein [Zafaria sp. Z1313]|uniref:HNH endonuclease n=1 Tax=unclassified Zafaria TaxID=2828765 RepID=UPI002E7686F7|nr:DUF222 domain-containing protein [Zafaria sp. J156]MEE1622307.1 DUF222 domain-containing protein [Zafaria sp. J156]
MFEESRLREAARALESPPELDGITPAEALERISVLEDLKSAACAAQARLAAAFDHAVREERRARGVPAERLGQGIGAQLGAARRESPHLGQRHLGLSRILVREMPHTLQALEAGTLNEWGATVLVRETACLTLEDRQHLDRTLCPTPDAVRGLGPRALAARAQQLAQALDPHSVVARAAKAESERRVTSRPAPDTMVNVTALLPVAAGVSVVAALSQEAERCRASGDRRSRGQIMADTLVERVTGRPARAPVDLEIQLVMTDRTLLQGESEPARLNGYGVVPAQWARDLIRSVASGAPAPPGGQPPGPPPSMPPAPQAPPAGPPSSVLPEAMSPDEESAARIWLRRLYTAPDSGALLGMDSRARIFPAGMKKFIAIRDAQCRMPWCDAPIRHYDHILSYASGGTTSTENGQGLCEACNYDKEANAWSAETELLPGQRHAVVITTADGERVRSIAPPLPGTPATPGDAPIYLELNDLPQHEDPHAA